MVRREQSIGELAPQFVTVRLVKCNGLDLSRFQFDWDLTFAAFFFNADGTLYARYGTRSQHDADKDVSIDGLAATMRAVLAIHGQYPDNAQLLSGKQPTEIDQKTPEEFPTLNQFQPELDYEGQVAKSCIHCHQIRDAQRAELRRQRQPLSDEVLFPFPAPETIGLSFDKQTRSTVRVQPESIAAKAGIENGDVVETLAGQIISSEADFCWALDRWTQNEPLPITIQRGGSSKSLKLELPVGWRRRTDISWRPTTWNLRRMATGGMVLKEVSDQRKSELGIEPAKMALVADHVGQFGDHARAKEAGLQKGDVILAFDGHDDFQRESEWLAFALQQRQPGDTVQLKFWRDGHVHTASFKLQ